ncbi:ShlB/FhaC/HecB family hemolysin secretion/activation protein [Aurantiacibacter sp. D1-12]|uniref:ShlB/FhaC/HecB family hemolysin secretion/activation protein n=1 Tax=Aurantiacibacter sp. D1-12 TaxID=2993658 RepID=UPI00237C5541|nr:ShlB/FhaC/HecB family hemolysin secretion/activation protein [Aurantiacibacter sp. D1-12]MDE1467286.1 ShlB/FhaC/HecB family hemolysin secretion/activation protein [Aurantiacibacter sp. D1-12]
MPSTIYAQDTGAPNRGELAPPQAQPDERQGVTLTVDGQMERRVCALDNPEYADLTVTLTGVDYTGAERAADVALEEAHRGYLNRELPIRALCDIRDRAAALLEDAGYLAAVEIPAQSLGDGRAEMGVVLGRLIAVRARGDTQGAEQLISGYLEQLVGQDVFRVSEAERSLLLANDVPGMEVRLSLRPAENGVPGDLIGEVAVIRQWGAIDANVQNWGSKALGRFGGLMRAEFYNVTGLGDRTAISAFSTLEFEEQQTLQISHDMRLGSDGLVLSGQVTLGWTNPDALPGFDIESETVFASLEASYPFLRTQTDSLWGAVGFDLVDQDVTINGNPFTRDRVRAAFLRGNYVHVDGDSVARRGGYSPFEPKFRFAATGELRQGLGILGASDDCRANPAACLINGGIAPARIGQDPTPFYGRASLGAEYRPIPLLTVAFDLEGQLSGSPLPAFEEYGAGNYGIGRGYDPSSILGDSGVGTSLELRYGTLVPSSAESLVWQPYVFTDLAWTDNEDAGLFDPTDELWSAGAGIRFVRGANVQGDVSVAVPLRRLDSTGERPGFRILFSITARLLPWRSS